MAGGRTARKRARDIIVILFIRLRSKRFSILDQRGAEINTVVRPTFSGGAPRRSPQYIPPDIGKCPTGLLKEGTPGDRVPRGNRWVV